MCLHRRVPPSSTEAVTPVSAGFIRSESLTEITRFDVISELKGEGRALHFALKTRAERSPAASWDGQRWLRQRCHLQTASGPGPGNRLAIPPPGRAPQLGRGAAPAAPSPPDPPHAGSPCATAEPGRCKISAADVGNRQDTPGTISVLFKQHLVGNTECQSMLENVSHSCR